MSARPNALSGRGCPFWLDPDERSDSRPGELKRTEKIKAQKNPPDLDVGFAERD
jgi:hypothetical protein